MQTTRSQPVNGHRDAVSSFLVDSAVQTSPLDARRHVIDGHVTSRCCNGHVTDCSQSQQSSAAAISDAGLHDQVVDSKRSLSQVEYRVLTTSCRRKRRFGRFALANNFTWVQFKINLYVLKAKSSPRITSLRCNFCHSCCIRPRKYTVLLSFLVGLLRAACS